MKELSHIITMHCEFNLCQGERPFEVATKTGKLLSVLLVTAIQSLYVLLPLLYVSLCPKSEEKLLSLGRMGTILVKLALSILFEAFSQEKDEDNLTCVTVLQ